MAIIVESQKINSSPIIHKAVPKPINKDIEPVLEKLTPPDKHKDVVKSETPLKDKINNTDVNVKPMNFLSGDQVNDMKSTEFRVYHSNTAQEQSTASIPSQIIEEPMDTS